MSRCGGSHLSGLQKNSCSRITPRLKGACAIDEMRRSHRRRGVSARFGENFEAAELLNIDVDQFTRMLALVTTVRFGRLQRGDPIETEALQYAADGSRRGRRPRQRSLCQSIVRGKRPQPAR
ncbi:hypothetical protein MES5069_520158 [Mesorhizobium escarrei]|uniref:Uncharacterized protein n=1 Tax=Mesorhizobium escarrei TaxID=666018 RepID=A0ABM9ECI5_9HYPH|nr:hypothetical protein MES5069_520158 [Mesorhizobium escarrei]